jgi:uroporphyrinogen decarboxylase
MQTQVKNTLLLDSLDLKTTKRRPVWMMRQAGRYLPEYMAIRKTMGFMELCKNPQKAAEVSIQPYEILGVDAIIMFSDILIPLEPMGSSVHFDNGKPEFREALSSPEQVAALKTLSQDDLKHSCHYVYETIEQIKSQIHGEVPVLGFAGAPWTLASYMIEGGGSKEFAKIKTFMYQQPKAMHELLSKLADTIANYLIVKLQTGVSAVQLFDTWASVLSQKDYQEFALPYQQRIITAIRQQVPDAKITLYVNGVANILDYMMQSGANCLSIDWRVSLADTRAYVAGSKLAIQGNFDPCYLLGPKDLVIRKTHEMLEAAGTEPGYIANLGHGILPSVPVENARAFIETVKSY